LIWNRKRSEKKNRNSISKAKPDEGIGRFWDIHDLAEFWDQTKKISFEVNIESEATYLKRCLSPFSAARVNKHAASGW
jgi:hypothetical protein